MPLSSNQQPDENAVPKDISGKEVLKNLSDILSDKEARTKLVTSIVSGENKRPPNWSKASNPPYYRERFALELKAHLDEMIVDQEDRLYRYEDFEWLSKNSLYLMLNQAFKYLIDKMDPGGRYAAFREMLSITREKDKHGHAKGIRFSIARDIRSGVPKFKSTKVLAAEDEWRNDMENFLEEAEENAVFEVNKVVLSPEEIYELETFLVAFPNIIHNVTATSIRLVKTSD